MNECRTALYTPFLHEGLSSLLQLSSTVNGQQTYPADMNISKKAGIREHPMERPARERANNTIHSCLKVEINTEYKTDHLITMAA